MTEEQREKNREKLRRFYRRHPGYSRKFAVRKDPLQLRLERNREHYRTFELADPRDEELLPRIIGYTFRQVKPVWSQLWSVRNLSTSRWAAWLRELASLGLTPIERPLSSLGVALGITKTQAHSIVKIRLRSINTAMTGHPMTPPEWNLRNIESYTGSGRRRPLKVGCQLPDGTIRHYPCLPLAAQDAGTTCQTQIRHCVWAVSQDSRGRLWWDD